MSAARDAVRRLRTRVDVVRARWQTADLAVFHQFRPAPYGGANQFLRALCDQLERRGVTLANNTIPSGARACLYNSFNFDYHRLRTFARPGCRMVHRVDGPVGVYRGVDEGIDRRICEMNHELADCTIFQSRYSRDRHAALGLKFHSPRVIHNAADPAIFHPIDRVAFSRDRKIRLIAVSWSDNPNKGAAVYKWLEERLDWSRFEFTFVGRSAVRFDRLRMLAPLSSQALADLLRSHDIFVTASLHESCSNALVEALSCGLPALFVKSGGNPELVGEAGFGFVEKDELMPLLDQLVDEYPERQRRLAPPTLSDVADQYLDALEIETR